VGGDGGVGDLYYNEVENVKMDDSEKQLRKDRYNGGFGYL